ncbi:ATP-dependent DNA helicase [Trichonephila clavipes]|nr:ATP-dependent DNA helicase [Trichonephila clavipes]
MGNILEAAILIGKFQGEVVLLPRIPMILSDSPIPFKRLQFPIRLPFAMTINKSQEEMDVVPKMPALLDKQAQLSIEDAKETSLVTSIRWVVEAVNGQLKK